MNFPLPSPLFPSRVIGGRERMTSSGLQFEVCVVHFKWIKGERGWI